MRNSRFFLQIVNSGESATMNCTVEGYPVESVEWLHDGVPVLTAQDTRIRLLAPLVLIVGSVGRRDKGMYQCLVRSDKENAQATAELKLGGKNIKFYSITKTYLFLENCCLKKTSSKY